MVKQAKIQNIEVTHFMWYERWVRDTLLTSAACVSFIDIHDPTFTDYLRLTGFLMNFQRMEQVLAQGFQVS